MTEEWANELSDMAFTSRSRGRMSHLLKKKSKVVKKQKPRAQHAPYNFLKRFQNENGKAMQPPQSQIDTSSISYDPIPKKIEPKVL